MTHGGRRLGAGRKSNAEIKNLRSVLENVITEQDWRALARDLYTRARKGDMRAAQLLLSYRFGDPFAIVPTEDEIKPITMIRVIVHEDGTESEIPVKYFWKYHGVPNPEPTEP